MQVKRICSTPKNKEAFGFFSYAALPNGTNTFPDHLARVLATTFTTMNTTTEQCLKIITNVSFVFSLQNLWWQDFFWDFQTLWTTAVAHRNDVPWYHNTKKKERIGWRMEIGGKIDKM